MQGKHTRKNWKTALTLTVTGFVFTACSEVSLAVANFPTHFSDVEIKRDIAFGDKPTDKLDIYVPARQGVQAKALPVIVFFYGGRWSYGARGDYAFVGTTLAKQGYLTVIPDYSKYPQVKFPTFVEDGAHAVQWVAENIENYGGNANDIFVAGHSAGAHIGALLAADEHYMKEAGGSAKVIKGFAGLAGPYDFEPEEPDLQDMFGPPENYPQMQVTTFIDGNEAPMFLQYGGQDDTVHIRNLNLLRDKINAEGGQVETRIYPELDHVGIVGAFSWVLKSKSSVVADMIAFFNEIREGNANE